MHQPPGDCFAGCTRDSTRLGTALDMIIKSFCPDNWKEQSWKGGKRKEEFLMKHDYYCFDVGNVNRSVFLEIREDCIIIMEFFRL